MPPPNKRHTPVAEVAKPLPTFGLADQGAAVKVCDATEDQCLHCSLAQTRCPVYLLSTHALTLPVIALRTETLILRF